MGRGFFSGVIWGSVLSVVLLWMVSTLGSLSAGISTPPEGMVVIAPEASKTVISDTTPQISVTTDTGIEESDSPVIPIPSAAPENAPQADQESAAAPQGDVQTPISPVENPSQGAGDLGSDSKTDPAPFQTTLPDLAQPSIDVAPSPSAPPAEPLDVAQADIEPTPETTSNPVSDPEPEQAPVIGNAPAQPSGPVEDVAQQPVISDFSQPVVVQTPPLVNTPQTDIATAEPTPVQPAREPSQTTDPDNTDPAAVQNTTPEPAALPEPSQEPSQQDTFVDGGNPDRVIAGPLPRILNAGGGSNTFKSVKRTALPHIGDSDPVPTDGEQVVQVEQTEEVAGHALKQFSQPFENPQDRPMMAIILLVDSNNPNPSQTSLPFPVSYVVDASQQNAKELMAAYRAKGHEVIALAPLPQGATPKDVEVAFQTYLAAVPEAVAVMDTPQGEFQSGRVVATQVVEALAASGHGLITYSRGLNAAPQVAEREGVPAALVFRVFDDKGQNGAAIKRFLDQAAFRAAQQPGVILVGHNRADTITALLEWSLGNRAGTVALAPVSAALLAP